ncbi:MAG: GatB/YqeY domain-containing protein [Chloroflexi bacterium]|nr:GatB/YqeY domain-containing protein [Chloroflexota bacterium]
MSLKEQLNEDLKAAMRTGDETRKNTIRLLKAAIMRAEQGKRDSLYQTNLEKARQDLVKKYPELRGKDWARLEEPWASQVNQYLSNLDVPDAADYTLKDAEVISVIQKEAKQRRDSIEAYRNGGRAELAAKESAELAILESYLPRQMTEAEIESVARQVIATIGAHSPAEMGAVMKELMPKVGAQADGKVVSQVVRRLLSEVR